MDEVRFPLKYHKIYWRIVSHCHNSTYFSYEKPVRVNAHMHYMSSPEEFYLRYCSDECLTRFFQVGIFEQFCPKSYSKKQIELTKKAIISWIIKIRTSDVEDPYKACLRNKLDRPGTERVVMVRRTADYYNVPPTEEKIGTTDIDLTDTNMDAPITNVTINVTIGDDLENVTITEKIDNIIPN